MEEDLNQNEEETKEEAEEETENETDEEPNSINRLNINNIINLVKTTIYNALFNYFDTLPNSILLASILDPRFKRMKGWPEEEKERTITLLKSEYVYFKNKKLLKSNHESKLKEKMISNFKLRLFEEEEEIINDNEINHYLDRLRIPQANRNADLFK
ncbi:17762_t:CDS:2, partial [Racocetra fulgida]